jgi:hypothetical protein
MAFFVAFFAIIAVAVPIPTMVVLHSAALALPVAIVITLSIVARRYPVRSAIGRTSPIPIMPAVVTLDRIPIAVDPNIIGTRSHWPNSNHARRRRWADPDAKIYLSSKCQSNSQQRQGKDFLYHV